MKQIFTALALTFSAAVSSAAFSSSYEAPKVTVRDIGVLGLFSHDLFAWDRKQQRDNENGRLDLSTIFDYAGGSRWQQGGNPKNMENAPVYSVTMDLVDFFKEQKAISGDEQQARRQTVAHFYGIVKDSFERVTGRSFPVAECAGVTTTNQATFRAFHDILPGSITLDSGELLYMTNFRTAMTRLSATELDRVIPTFDGQYDPAYLAITHPGSRIPPINLYNFDRDFVETQTSYNFASMLEELGEVGAGARAFADLSFYDNFEATFRKATCREDNPWLDVTL